MRYDYGNAARPVIDGANIAIARGDRILVEGPSGGGKSTLAGLLTGLRPPSSGLLLLNGLDRPTIGDDWHSRVTAAPQFHENHIPSGTLAFNLTDGPALARKRGGHCRGGAALRGTGSWEPLASNAWRDPPACRRNRVVAFTRRAQSHLSGAGPPSEGRCDHIGRELAVTDPATNEPMPRYCVAKVGNPGRLPLNRQRRRLRLGESDI
ncbi:MAG: ATP-binding cassette domain-containing protein [Sphingomonadales bacterium]|nr:ATP-binding cassette domain-containing protein [Sphingomonadales bacterium]